MELTQNPSVLELVRQTAELTTPKEIVWIDGSEAQLESLRKIAVETGELIKLNEEKLPGCYLNRSDVNDVARVEGRTFICSRTREEAGPTNNWMDPDEMKAKLHEILRRAMAGRTMYVIPYSMGVIGSPFAKYGIEVTDSIYVVLNMAIMTRIGTKVLDALGDSSDVILGVHSKGKPLAQDADLESLAKRTVGFSGADLENVVNEAALLTARENGQLITAAALEESVDRVIGGPRRKSKIISERDKKITAYHEGGHALAAWAMPDVEPVYKLTILPRGRTGGHALVVPEEDKDMMTRSEMIGRLVFALGGRSAEELVFHEPTTGASSDIEQATKIARAMVTEYGMTARLGAVKYGKEEGDPFLGRSAGQQPNYSLEVAHEIDEEVRKLIEAAHTEAWEILNTYRDVLDNLVLELIDKETLNRKDLERIFADVKKRPRITAFNDFGGRTPSEKPPVKTPGELAKERGEPWPPVKEEPAPSP